MSVDVTVGDVPSEVDGVMYPLRVAHEVVRGMMRFVLG